MIAATLVSDSAINACEAGRGDDTALTYTVDAAHTGHNADPNHMERGSTLRAAEASSSPMCRPRLSALSCPSMISSDALGSRPERHTRREIAFDPFDADEAEVRGRADDASRSFGEDHHPGDVGI